MGWRGLVLACSLCALLDVKEAAGLCTRLPVAPVPRGALLSRPRPLGSPGRSLSSSRPTAVALIQQLRDRLRGGARAKREAPTMAEGDKEIVLIRHGVTEMNVHLGRKGYGSQGFEDPGFWDTRLTPEGQRQAESINKKIADLGPLDLLVSSPLSRAIHTATLAFRGTSVPRVVSPLIRERMWLSSDVGSSPENLAAEFGKDGWDFSGLEEKWWYTSAAADWRKDDWRAPGKYLHEGEPEEPFRKRLEEFKVWLQERPERRVAVVAHWGVIHALTGLSLDNCEIRSTTLKRLLEHQMVCIE